MIVEQLSKENCCDELRSEIEKLKEPVRPTYTSPCDASMLPNVLFDLNSYGVKSEFQGQLSTVAGYLKSNPGVKVCVVGHTDNRSGAAYNEVLSWKRANEVISELVGMGVSRSQLVLKYDGEVNPVVSGLEDGSARKGIDAQHALNRRVSFRCCMAGQGDSPRPAGPDAGVR